jgi:hypothetical protein
MALLGARAAVDLVTPTGIDGNKIYEFETLKTEETPLEIIQKMAIGVGTANEELVSLYGSMILFTEEITTTLRQGETSRSMTPYATEYREPDPIRSNEIGSMLPLLDYDDAIGWTTKSLKNRTKDATNYDVELVTERWINRFGYEIYRRMLYNTEYLIGAAGYDVPWAIGTGTNVDYIPPQWRGNVFGTSHSHFNVYNTAAPKTFADVFEGAADDLTEHGLTGQLITLCNEDDARDTIRLLDNFVPLVPPTIARVGNTDASPIYQAAGEFKGVPGTQFGWYNTFKGLMALYSDNRMPAGYTFTYQAGSARRPLAIRQEAKDFFGLIPDVRFTNSVSTPKISGVVLEGSFGVGVNDRLNGVASYLATGVTEWANPTIT